MPKIRRRHFKTWEGLTSFLDKTFSYYNQFIFRGQANADWSLESSLTRALNISAKNRSKFQKKVLVTNHLASFKDNIRGRSGIDLRNVTEDDLWALGQHFGLATPLLDWTTSPYVALYFALEQPLESKRRCVWALSVDYLEKHNYKRTGVKLKMIRPLSNENPRLVSQQGLFLKVPFDKSVEEIIEIVKSKTIGVYVYKLTFDSAIRYQALSILNNMNINKLTLYPDLIGAALHSNYKLEVEPHLVAGRVAMWTNYVKKYIANKNLGPLMVRKTPKGWQAKFQKLPIIVNVKNERDIKHGLRRKLNEYLKKTGTGAQVKDFNFDFDAKKVPVPKNEVLRWAKNFEKDE